MSKLKEGDWLYITNKKEHIEFIGEHLNEKEFKCHVMKRIGNDKWTKADNKHSIFNYHPNDDIKKISKDIYLAKLL
jgi:hypothetical protein